MKKLGTISGTVALLMTSMGAIAWFLWPAEADRSVVMIARDMAFHVEGYNTSNPTLTLPTNVLVTLELRNADPGMIHDLLVESLERVHTGAVAHGKTARLTFRTPREPLATDYLCTFHGQTMRGRMRFE